jgi:hypothetical protein
MSDYEGGTFRCQICAKEFLTKYDADIHYQKVHSDEVTSIGEWLSETILFISAVMTYLNL